MDIFIDSWGGFWTPCDPGHAEAEAFGPMGAARRVEFAGYSSIAAAIAGGTYIQTAEPDAEGWQWVLPHPRAAVVGPPGPDHRRSLQCPVTGAEMVLLERGSLSVMMAHAPPDLPDGTLVEPGPDEFWEEAARIRFGGPSEGNRYV